ncbi:hypothetical protein Mth01_12680 [Sphaerimonospora thailandensis]|uniref:PpGpp synthetase/RelA/SpoT-type nucleotidyltransferase n=1 Tax=Sphaerimonospora thailandensis TaxID=795644 RepID=A0A8J3R713_9ACTN|nr:hypothetical protein Mth01_12680 [Sphaerimonospora thailandensis]
MEPSHGYRAVHVIVFLDGIPVEIQVRTELQDVWAQILERLADHWGRGIRYGKQPESPEAVVRIGARQETHRELLDSLGRLGDFIDRLEVLRLAAFEVEDRFRDLLENVNELQAVLDVDSEAGREFDMDHDVWDQLVTAYQESMRTLGREAVVPSPPGTVEALRRLLANTREAHEASRQHVRTGTDEVEAAARHILSEFALAAEEVSVEP